MPEFTHLHVHSQYSLLDGAAAIKGMIEKAKLDEMKAIALTDHGNMFGAFHFVNEAKRQGIKPIMGCEFYITEDRFQQSFTRDNRDKRFHQLLLAKDQDGYKNLSKLCSLGFIEGLYGKYPRIDKELVLKYHKGLIATTCCLGAEVPQAILHKGEAAAEEIFKWWLDLFGEDYYVELQRHNLPDIDNTGMSQEDVNQVLIKWARKYNVKIIATNDSHYVEQKDFNAHDILLCINTGDLQATPIGDGKGYRFGFPNDQFYFKTQAEMLDIFSDIPEAIGNTGEIADKITAPELMRNILLPNYSLPPGFDSEDEYLKQLAFEGAKTRYPEMTTEHEERLNYELGVIKEMGFAGYFLIVQDFTGAAKKLNVAVGPGRGSAAGSAVAFCTGITNIDPLKYKLLFERFLNPERISMPDIDIDFDDEGRQKVIDYVVDKYGRNQVAQIITYGRMAAKMSIRDVARVIDLPLNEADKLAKLVPMRQGINIQGAYKEVPELKAIRKQDNIQARTLQLAETLEGSVRNTGIHAAGIIIAPDDLTEYIPVCTSKDSELWITQFEGKHIEDAGMLKMDFLGLKTLSIIKDAVDLIKENHGVEIDPDNIPLDDEKTFDLFRKGQTIGIFQFESRGMRMYLKELKPTDIEDLIAMAALYRPGPMQFIELYINRKHGIKNVNYPHPLLEPILESTYGIMVYQEQIMKTAQILAGYTLGEADVLRRAMGKKKMDVMEKHREVFIEGAKKLHDIDRQKATEVFDVMVKFAEYGFNRSHSAAYSVLAYQTAYLKANYPGEYMASVLTNNMNDIKKVTFFMDECRRQGVPVLGPDVNESAFKFVVNKKGEIRIGLGAVKGVGEGAVDAIVEERRAEGAFENIFDVTKRVNLRAANKKSFESLAYAGAFDSFGPYRSQYFFQKDNDSTTLIEKAIKFGNTFQDAKNNSQHSLFGEQGDIDVVQPELTECEAWPKLKMLQKEKEIIGIYISGHPLDDYKLELTNFCKNTVAALKDLESLKGKELSFAGIVTKAEHLTTKSGNPYGRFTVEDYTDTIQLSIFSKDYIQFKGYLVEGWFLYLKARVEPRYNDATQMEIKISQIHILSEVKDKLAKSITLKVELPKLNDEFLDSIGKITNANPGKCHLKFLIEDSEDDLRVTMPSKKILINPSKEFINSLSESNIEYKFN